ncbi:hypothetical protein ACFLZ0_01210 [Patescibacteria group bacterium]
MNSETKEIIKAYFEGGNAQNIPSSPLVLRPILETIIEVMKENETESVVNQFKPGIKPKNPAR